MASCVEAGPGRRLVAAMPSSNSRSDSHRRWSTHSWRRSAMWAGGPPNPMQPIRAHSRATTASGTRWVGCLKRGAESRRKGGGGCTPTRDRPLAGRLEQFDRVAGGVVDQDLGAAGPGHDVVAELHSFSAEPLDLGRYVVDKKVDAVPAAWAGFAPVGHRAPGRAGRPTEQQPQVPPNDIDEGRCRIGEHGEPEMGGVELDGGIDVVDHVADADHIFRHVRSPPDVMSHLG